MANYPDFMKPSQCFAITASDTNTSDSLRSTTLSMAERNSDSDVLITDNCYSETSSCGYPALSVISRSPSPRSIPDTPQVHRNQRISNRMLRTCIDFVHRTGSASEENDHSIMHILLQWKKVRNCTNCMVDEGSTSVCATYPMATMLWSSSRNSSTPTERQNVERNFEKQKLSRKTDYKSYPRLLRQGVISILKSPRPKSAPGVQTQHATHCNTNTDESNRRPIHKVSFVSSNEEFKSDLPKLITRHTQTDTGIQNLEDNSSLNATTQTRIERGSIGVQCDVLSRLKKNKECQTNCNSRKNVEYPKGKRSFLMPEEISSFDKLRTNSAQCSRQTKNKENVSFERCKSAIAILITHTRVSSSSGERKKEIRSESAEISIETSSEFSEHKPRQTSTKQRDRSIIRSSVRPHTSYHSPKSVGNRLFYCRGISSAKLANLRKAYGRRNVDLSGLNISTRKPRLPMHCGYRCMSANQVDDIVNRLSSCHLNGPKHDCLRSPVHRCWTTTPNYSPLLARSNREIDNLSAKANEEMEKLRRRQNNYEDFQKNGAMHDFENVISSSIKKIDDSLMEAKNVLSSLSGIIDSVSPPIVRKTKRSVVSSATTHRYKRPSTNLRRPQTWNSSRMQQRNECKERRTENTKNTDARDEKIRPHSTKASTTFHKEQLPRLNIADIKMK